MLYENDVKNIIEAQKGNEKSMDKLIQDNNGLIWSIVKRFSGRGYELDDLYQIGSIGFIKSIKRFDTTFDVRLSTYAVPYILGEIKRFIRDDGNVKVSRSIKELVVKIKEIQERYLKEKGEEISINQIAKELKTTKEEIALAIDSLNPVVSIYESTGSGDEDGINLIDRIKSQKDEAEEIANRITVRDMISSLNDRDKKIILLRYFKNNTQSQVAKIMGISQVQVSRIEKRILDGMKQKIIS